ncbi:hypothetical protein F0562_006195 [Nyssa sinensis]|uniref:BED-type domain-containing protein n=1 Tax=Nyssa sinensis TaxID=561372 RepID=A0A5J5ANY7_9ASTE|nr:hypothetical protein F0562_006195 [Nyssa sinensis]
MSIGQPGFTSQEQDSCNPFSFEESSTSPLMEDIDQDGIDVGGISNDERNNGNDEGNNENMGNEANDTQNVDADPHKHAFQRKPRKRTSTIWNDFEEVVDADGFKKVKCNYCLEKFNMPSTGATTQFHRHLKRCTQHQLASKKQMVLSVETVAFDCARSIANFKYDRAKVRELAAHMTLYHEYPFMQMEDVIFNKFMRTNTPYWQKITRTTIKNDCISAYEIEKKKLKTLFKSINKVNIMTDMWKSSNQKIGYMVVTGHFIDSDWNLQKRVLTFFHVPPPHSGVIVADALQKCFIEWGIEDKVSTITVDNARYNDVALRILKDNFTLKKKLSFGGRIFHVRCCAHIINLLVQAGIKEVKGIVDIVREGVKYLIASDARMIQFSDIAKQLQLSSKKLILDCPTRWNSTYMMLATALEFREVYPRYQDRDPSFIYVPSVEDWVKVEHRIKVLLNEKSVDDNEFIRAMALMMKAKFDKYWSECNLLMAIAGILDPRYKMIIVNYCFPNIYPEAEANKNIVTVKQALYEIYNEYVVTHVATHIAQGEGGQGTTREIGSSSASGGDHDIGKKIVTGSSLILGHVSRTVDTIQPSKSDLDIYLDESAFICSEGSANKFDIMGWWKANTLKFRILSKMARDILSIPITSVASESTFSAGGRVIDLYRASLLPEIINVIASLLSGRLVRERIGPAMLSAIQSQMGAVETNFEEVQNIFDTSGAKGLPGDSVEKIPKIEITRDNNVDASGERVSCSVCLQDFQLGETVRNTMMKFASFETIVEYLYKYAIPTPKDQCSKTLQLGVSFAGGYVAGVFCAIVSHPADNLVSFLNNAKGATMGHAVKKLGLWGLFTSGLPLRIVMIGTLTGAQWGIYDAFKVFVGLPTTGGPAPAAAVLAKV